MSAKEKYDRFQKEFESGGIYQEFSQYATQFGMKIKGQDFVGFSVGLLSNTPSHLKSCIPLVL